MNYTCLESRFLSISLIPNNPTLITVAFPSFLLPTTGICSFFCDWAVNRWISRLSSDAEVVLTLWSAALFTGGNSWERGCSSTEPPSANCEFSGWRGDTNMVTHSAEAIYNSHSRIQIQAYCLQTETTRSDQNGCHVKWRLLQCQTLSLFHFLCKMNQMSDCVRLNGACVRNSRFLPSALKSGDSSGIVMNLNQVQLRNWTWFFSIFYFNYQHSITTHLILSGLWMSYRTKQLIVEPIKWSGVSVFSRLSAEGLFGDADFGLWRLRLQHHLISV